jgi:hypothetical protein
LHAKTAEATASEAAEAAASSTTAIAMDNTEPSSRNAQF